MPRSPRENRSLQVARSGERGAARALVEIALLVGALAGASTAAAAAMVARWLL